MAETAPMSNAARIAQIRRRKRLRQLRLLGLCVLLLAGLLAYFLGAFGTPLALLGDLADTISIAATAGDGFPRTWKLSGYMQAQPLAGGIVLLGEREAVLYGQNGNELRRVPHGYNRPALAIGDTRFCVYNRAGTQLQVESRTRNLFSQTFTEPITHASLSPNGTLVVALKTGVEVYSPLFEKIWTWKNVGENLMHTAFSTDNTTFAVASLAVQDGALATKLHFFRKNAQVEKATALQPDGIPLYMEFTARNKLLVVYDTCAVVYDANDGKELFRYAYGARQLQSVNRAEGTLALLFGSESYDAVTNLVLLDNQLRETATVSVGRSALSVAIGHKYAYVLTENEVLSYTLRGEVYATTSLADRPLALVNANQMLLLTTAAIEPFAPKTG